MLRIFAFSVASMLAALPLAAESQTRHEHHPQPTAPAKAAPQSAPAKAAAQPAPAPASAAARAPHSSAFARYQRFTPDEPLKDWRQVNDTVRAIGGWQVYGLEAARAIEAEKKAQGGKP
ncbi:MAG: hypothetical protein SF172_00890 [Burkholderiales bacterium]|nr:hypothetical protein [Burkholderiales bacterium]